MGHAVSSRPVLPLWAADFVQDTVDLSAAEGGAYIFLLLYAWSADGSLPNDDYRLSRIAHAGKNWHRLRPRVMQFFKLDGAGRWRQKRLSAEIEKIDGISGRRKNAAGKRWGKQPKGPVDNPVDNPVETCGQPRAAREAETASRKQDFPNEINGRPMQVHSTLNLNSQNIASRYVSSRSARASGNAAQQKQEIKKDFGQSRPAAPARQKPKNYFQARAAWEAELAKGLGPDDYARALDHLVADPGLCERATAAEQRQPGAGLQTALAGLTKHARAKP
jgi:uncharacterized protein YdaU (DUF1376 family)